MKHITTAARALMQSAEEAPSQLITQVRSLHPHLAMHWT
jgi:hypothetical protein